MSAVKRHWDDYESGKKHALKVLKKKERIAGLKDLLSMWEKIDDAGYDEETHEYVLQLRAKLRCAENQMEAMGL